MKSKYLIGIDEAGRGPLAGPVSVGVFGIKKGFKIKNFPKGKDSKKMSESEREFWFEVFKKEQKKTNIFFKVCFASEKNIDQKGISFCINGAIQKGLKDLSKKISIHSQTKILLDGLLKAPSIYKNQKTVIKGDEKEKIIACASIVAKVSRDRLMKKYAKKYPIYGFEKHKGYGTKSHLSLISKYGLSSIHRKTYCKNP